MDDYELNVSDYLRVLRRGWYLLVGAVVVCVAAAYGLTSLQSERYRSTADVLVRTQESAALLDSTGTRPDADERLETEVAFIESAVMREAVTERVGRSHGVDARTVGDASVIEIRVTDGDPRVAAEFADAYAETYIDLRRQRAVDEYLATAQVVQDRIDDLDDQLADLPEGDPGRSALESQRLVYLSAIESLALAADLSGGTTAQIISPANVPSDPFSPNPTRNAILGGIVGVVLGLGLVVVRETLDDRLRSKEDLESASGLPTLAVIPTVSTWRKREEEHLISVEEPSSDTAEAYRTLRTALQFFAIDRPLRTVQVTSSNPGEGKTTTVTNLAVTMARAGRRVLVVDGDLRSPRIHRFFGIRRTPGITDVLLGETPPRVAAGPVPAVDELPLLAIAAGRPTTNPSEALGGRTTRELLEFLAGAADIVLVDSPPVLPVSDALVLAGQVDAVLFVAQAGRTRKRDLARATELLAQVRAPVLGTVLNDAPRGGSYGYAYHGYGYPVVDGDSPRKRRNGDRNIWDDAEAAEGEDTLDHDLEVLFHSREPESADD